MKKTILGVHIPRNAPNIPAVQKALADYAGNIKTRLGLHEVEDPASPSLGLLIIETFGPAEAVLKMEDALKAIPGISVRSMVFENY